MVGINKEKWNEMYAEAKRKEKPILWLYRALIVYPYRAFLLTAGYVSISVFNSGIDTSEFSTVLIVVVANSLMFYFGLKFLVWFLLRLHGFPADYLKLRE